jgi:catechol 2,3-dioxygenase-like lactoylglutathione lyase family enzyme
MADLSLKNLAHNLDEAAEFYRDVMGFLEMQSHHSPLLYRNAGPRPRRRSARTSTSSQVDIAFAVRKASALNELKYLIYVLHEAL